MDCRSFKHHILSRILLIVRPHDSEESIARRDWDTIKPHVTYFICWGLRSWHLIVQTQMNLRSRNSSTWIGAAQILNFYTFFIYFKLISEPVLALSTVTTVFYFPCHVRAPWSLSFLDFGNSFKPYMSFFSSLFFLLLLLLLLFLGRH